jgi:hypothetical protein
MVDDRPLDAGQYHGMAAAINATYALAHSYDFAYLRPYLSSPPTEEAIRRSQRQQMRVWQRLLHNPSDLRRSVWDALSRQKAKMLRGRRLGPLPAAFSSGAKCRAVCYCSRWKAYRGASWAKLLGIARALVAGYEVIAYLDSDCVFRNLPPSLDQQLQAGGDASIICLADRPWYTDLPNGGYHLWRRSPEALPAVLEWWNCYSPVTNLEHDFEQRALHQLMRSKGSVLSRAVGVIEGAMFAVETPEQLLHHIPSSKDASRAPTFNEYARRLGVDLIHAVDVLNKGHVSWLDCREVDSWLQTLDRHHDVEAG